jgi:hypothetical protein
MYILAAAYVQGAAFAGVGGVLTTWSMSIAITPAGIIG